MSDYDLEMANSVIAARDIRIAALEAENESLKCCGNCGHYVTTGSFETLHMCTEDSFEIEDCSDPCHFTPSRWTPYWQEA